MGVPADALYQPADPFAERTLAVAPLADLEQEALTARPDLKRIEAQQSAQELSVAIAKSSFGPRPNAFTGWEMDNPTLLAGGGGNSWLGGIELQIDLFSRGRETRCSSTVEVFRDLGLAFAAVLVLIFTDGGPFLQPPR
jgi:outer membrane protein TolC